MPLTPRYRLPEIRLDPEPLDRGWRTPRPDRREWSASLKFLVLVAVLILLIGTIWTAGGLGRRSDKVRSYAAGQLLDAGPMLITMDRITITWTPRSQYKKDDTDKWKVVGTGRATSKVDTPTYLIDPGVIVLPSGRRFKAGIRFGDTGSLRSTSELQPGLSDVPTTIEGEIPGDWQPTGLLRIGVWEQQYAVRDPGMAASTKMWINDSTVLAFWCPVRRLPDGI